MAARRVTTSVQGLAKDVPGKAPNTLNILLVGKTGNGKSSTGNSLLGQKKFDEGVGKSVTKTCKEETTVRFNEKICVIDTPGLCDTEGVNALQIINEYISTFKRELHVICLVLSSSNRPTPEEITAIVCLCKEFGHAMLAYLIVVVTRDEDLRREKKKAKDFLLAYTGAGADLFKDCVKDDRVVGFDNFNEEWREKQVQTLLQKTKEIVARHKDFYTYSHLQEQKRIIEKEREKIRIKEQQLKDERKRLQEAKIEQEERRVRHEEQEKAAREREKEMRSIQQRHVVDSRRQQEEVNRQKEEFKNQMRQVAMEFQIQFAQLNESQRQEQDRIKRLEDELRRKREEHEKKEEEIKDNHRRIKELEQKKGGLWNAITNILDRGMRFLRLR